MPYEPLVILHIALTTEVTASIKSLIRANANDGTTLTTATETTKETGPFTNAIFYSINSCQKGLQQVDLGKFFQVSLKHFTKWLKKCNIILTGKIYF